MTEASSPEAIRARHELPAQDTWDVASVYATPADYEADLARVDGLVAPLAALRGKLDSAAAVAGALQLEDDLGLLLDRLHLYAHMIEDQNTTASDGQARMAALNAKIALIHGELAWIAPEILAQPEATLVAWLNAPELAPFRRSMELLLRQKPHVLSAAEETILGLAGDAFSTPYQAFGMLTNADLTFRPATGADGQERPVTNGSYGPLMENRDRVLRRSAFESLYDGYGSHKNSLAALLSGQVKTHVLDARVRRFGSSLDAALFPDNVPSAVYHALIKAVGEVLPLFHRYVALRAKTLGLADLDMWDVLVPIVPEVEVKVDWEQCRRWVLDALAPLGADYLAVAERAFGDRWFDVWENKGKRSGAYSTGAYGHKPFMLLNFHGTLDDVFTVAHELGHSMHTYLSQASQPYRYSGYPIFLAEIASTTNEALLLHHLLKISDDPRMRAFLLNHYCDAARGTLFRQTMFAEFELELHRRAEAGEPVTAEALSEYYYALNARHYGPNIKATDKIGLEWARIPHFYYDFYVYKYATGFAAAQVFSRRVLEGGASRDAYLNFLRSGSSLDPLETVQRAGVDLADSATVRQAFGLFEQAIGDLDASLAALA